MRAYICLSALICACSSATPTSSVITSSWQEIEDHSGLSILNPEFNQRKIAKLRLANGLEVYLVSDPAMDQSCAMLSVDAGSWSDPVAYPGMAHFCEHMLFMGTKKYPDENAFHSQVSDQKGQTNAYTAPHQTAYMFSAQTNGFLPLLDRFAHFFIDPLFSRSSISREMHAVDQEFAKNIENDAWRQYQVFKETSNQDHPNCLFSTGNASTLGSIPDSALRDWHQAHYSANCMHLAIYSPLSLDTLRTQVVETFSEIPTTSVAPIPQLPITSAQQRGQITYIQPIMQRRDFTLRWELPSDLAIDTSQPAQLIAYVLESGNLKTVLKKQEWIDSLSISVDDLGGPQNRLLDITLSLTKKGWNHLDQAVLLCFEALAGLRSEGIPSYLFDEKNRLAELSYQYQSRQDAFQLAYSLANTLSSEPLETYPRNQLLATRLNAQSVKATLAHLTPETCLFYCLAPSEETKVTPDHKERWMGVEYAIRPIPNDWETLWNRARPSMLLSAPAPNRFIPATLSMLPTEPSQEQPTILSKTANGVAYYTRSPEFQLPQTAVHFRLSAPTLLATPKSAALTELYLDHLTDLLQPTLEEANRAGLHASFSIDRATIHVALNGFSDKAPRLLEEISRTIARTPMPSRNQFVLYTNRHARAYRNTQKELAVMQAKELMQSLLDPYNISSLDKLEALKGVSYEEFLTFTETLCDRSHLQALFSGNISQADAETLWSSLQTNLVRSPYTPEQIKNRPLQLPAGGPFSLARATKAQGHATILVIDQGAFDFKQRAAQEILTSILKQDFFTELRTKQKTGYIAQAAGLEAQDQLYQILVVQSNTHQPEDLLYRFEQFLEGFNQELSHNVSPERFQLLQNNLVEFLANRYRNLSDKSALWDHLAAEKGADFDFVNKRINAVKALSYAEFLSISNNWFARGNRKRVAILYKGKLDDTFSYQRMSVSDLRTAVPAPTATQPQEQMVQQGQP